MKPLLLILVTALPLVAFPVPKSATPRVVGTWKVASKCSDGNNFNYFITLEEGGKLRYHDQLDGKLSSHGTWEQEGEALKWVINNYTFYEGTYNGESITGNGRDTDRRTSTAVLTRVVRD